MIACCILQGAENGDAPAAAASGAASVMSGLTSALGVIARCESDFTISADFSVAALRNPASFCSNEM